MSLRGANLEISVNIQFDFHSHPFILGEARRCVKLSQWTRGCCSGGYTELRPNCAIHV